jgi:hypothetical protein
VTVLIVSEGALDVGTSGRRAVDYDASDERRGAVSVLVRRLLEQKWGREVADWELERAVLPRAHHRSEEVSGYPRKVLLAITEAAARKCSSVVIVVDRDRTDGGSRLAELREGRALAEADGKPLAYRTALGVAIEMVEAWLLADEKALNEALGLAPPTPAIADPEQLDGGPRTDTYPKSVFRSLVKRGSADSGTPYDDVAARTRLDVIERRCRAGFAPFAQEVRERCG